MFSTVNLVCDGWRHWRCFPCLYRWLRLDAAMLAMVTNGDVNIGAQSSGVLNKQRLVSFCLVPSRSFSPRRRPSRYECRSCAEISHLMPGTGWKPEPSDASRVLAVANSLPILKAQGGTKTTTGGELSPQQQNYVRKNLTMLTRHLGLRPHV